MGLTLQDSPDVFFFHLLTWTKRKLTPQTLAIFDESMAFQRIPKSQLRDDYSMGTQFFSIEAMRAMSGGEQVGQMPKSTGAAIVLAKAAHTRREASSKSRCEQGLLTHCSVNRFLS